MATVTKPRALHYTGNNAADALLAKDPMALLIGFALVNRCRSRRRSRAR